MRLPKTIRRAKSQNWDHAPSQITGVLSTPCTCGNKTGSSASQQTPGNRILAIRKPALQPPAETQNGLFLSVVTAKQECLSCSSGITHAICAKLSVLQQGCHKSPQYLIQHLRPFVTSFIHQCKVFWKRRPNRTALCSLIHAGVCRETESMSSHDRCNAMVSATWCVLVPSREGHSDVLSPKDRWSIFEQQACSVVSGYLEIAR